MTSGVREPGAGTRASILAAVRSPLGFLALAVLVFEALLMPLVFRAEGTNLSVLLWGMLILIFGLLGASLFIIVRHPGVLGDQDPKLRDELTAARTAARNAEGETRNVLRSLGEQRQELEGLRASNQALQTRLNDLTSLRNRLVAVLHRSDSVSDIEIFREMGVDTNPADREQVLALLGVLIDEGRAVRATLTGYYKAASRS